MPASTRRKAAVSAQSDHDDPENKQGNQESNASSTRANNDQDRLRDRSSSKDPDHGATAEQRAFESPSRGRPPVDAATAASGSSSSSRSHRSSLSINRGRTPMSSSLRASPGQQAHLFSPPTHKNTDRGFPSSTSSHRSRECPPAASTAERSLLDARKEYDQLDLLGGEFFDFDTGDSPSRELRDSMDDIGPEPGSARRRAHLRRSPEPHPFPYMAEGDSSTMPRSAYKSRSTAPYSASRNGGPGRQYYHTSGPPPPYYYAPPPYSGSQDAGRTPVRGTPGSRRSPYHGGPPHGYSPYYRYNPDRPHWDTGGHSYPLPHGANIGPPYDSDEEPIPPPPNKKRPLSPSAAERNGPAMLSTPQKIEKTRSPFRSPPPESASRKMYRSSPFFQPSPTDIGTSMTFDFEAPTPSGTLSPGDFPSFDTAEFPGEPFPMAAGWNFLRTNSQDSESSPLSGVRRRPPEPSPLSGYMNDLSPIETPGGFQGIPRSPMHHPRSARPPNDGYQDGYSDAASRNRANAVTVSENRSMGHGSRLDPAAEPKELWPPSGGSSSKSSSGTLGPVRLEIGGTASVSTRKTLQGINSMMQNRRNKATTERDSATFDGRTPIRHPHPATMHQQQHPPPPGPHRPPYARPDMSTPVKSYHPRPPPGSGRRHQYPYPGPPGSGTKPMYPPSAIKTDFPPGSGPPKPMFMGHPIPDTNIPPPHSGVSPPEGKENNKKKSSTKRSPCNCKKSRCLKLYCECFAAKRYCQGCNCADCGNTPEAGETREKAIKDTRAKNAKAFLERFVVKNPQAGEETPQKVHNMGCKCKKSHCLKKYCECFQAGVICAAKCKCAECLNYAGSQALIDKRRKIKDQKGADFAMRVSHERWKGQSMGSGRKQPPPGPPPPPHHRRPIPSPGGRMPPPPHMMHPSPHGPPPPGAHPYHNPHQYPRHHYMGPPHMMGHHPPLGYSPMGVPMTPAGYHGPPHRMHHPEGPHSRGMYPPHPNSRPSSASKPPQKAPPPAPKEEKDPKLVTPKTPANRTKFDPATSRKKRTEKKGEYEKTDPYFGSKFPEQPKTAALAIFSFLSNEELYNASLVCKRWSRLAVDEEIWDFQ